MPSGQVVAWISPPDPQEQSRLSRWCDTVGPVFFEPDAAALDAAAIDQIAVVSWNIHEGSGDVGALVAQLRAGAFTAGAPVEHFVLLLQEVTRRDRSVPATVAAGDPVPHSIAPRHAAGAGLRRLAADGYAVLYAPSMRNGRTSGDEAEDRGNAIVSTLPLAGARVIELPLERQRRAAVAAVVNGRTTAGAPWRLDLVDVHLDTALALWHDGPFEARRRQAAALLAALDPSAADTQQPRAILLGGDFNTWRGDTEPAARLLHEAFPGTPAADRSPTWRGPLGVHATLDHIFVGGAATASPVARLPGRFGSDHFPLLTILRF